MYEFSPKFMATLTEEQKAILAAEAEAERASELEKFLNEQKEKDQAEAAHAEAMKAFLK